MPTDLSDCYDEDRSGAIAMDCVMAGGGSDGSLDICVWICLVDEDEKLIFNTFVQPQIPITNYRYFREGFRIIMLFREGFSF